MSKAKVVMANDKAAAETTTFASLYLKNDRYIAVDLDIHCLSLEKQGRGVFFRLQTDLDSYDP